MQIPRNSLAWLLVAQIVIFLPHTGHAPAWLWAVWLVVALWRWQIFRGAWNFPGSWVKMVLMVICGGGLAFSYGGLFSMGTMVSLLLAAFILKLLELRRRRDLLVLCYLGYFVAGTQFLFHSNLVAAFYGLFSVVVLTAALLASHQSLHQYRFWHTFRLTGVLLLQATPLMLILFLVVPRVGTLWSVPTEPGNASTGISDSMSPGEISHLAQSNALAFRVTFEDSVPPPAERYWRGLVFSDFDGRTWRQGQRQQLPHLVNWDDEPPAVWRDQIERLGRPVRYEVMLEPSHEHWLYTLPAPSEWSDGIGIGAEFRLQTRQPVRQRIQYQVTSYMDYRYQRVGLADWERRQEVQFPSSSNPRTQERIQQWRAELDSDEALINRLLEHYRASFRYTLQPQTLGRHSVDEFLWDTQEGFCEHFASSFAFALRVADIPARVVVGYQGGERSPLQDYWIIRQRDAHAWTEVWLENQGWVRIDPTAAVAPERIEQGVSEMSQNEAYQAARGFGGSAGLFLQLSLRWDLLNYQWNRWVLGYDNRLQDRLMDNWLGGTDPWRIALAILVTGGASVALLLAVILWQQRPHYPHPADRYYARFCARLARAGLSRAKGEDPRAYAQRVIAARPDLAEPVASVTRYYEYVAYGDDHDALDELRAAVQGLKV
jgi:protein-glutamine gamma-glutamyltransferase